MLEDEARHHPEPLESEVAAGEGELSSGDVAAFIEALLAILEGGEHEKVGALVEPRLAQPDAVHDAIAKCQFGHGAPRRGVHRRAGGLAASGKTFRVKKMTARPHRHNSPKRTIKRPAGLVSRLLDSHPLPEMRAFKYDVAISATEFDALAATELKRRLEHVLAKGVHPGAPIGATPAIAAAARKALEKEARVVVVLHQRLWGVASNGDAAAIKTRVGTAKRKDLVIVPIDSSPVPSWLKGVVVKAAGSPTSAAVIDAVVAAVTASGGAPKRLTEAAIAARLADEETRARARASFLSSQRAFALINRELDALSNTVLKLCQAPGTLPDGLSPQVRRTPDRYTVQIGPVGLSFSWIRGRTNSIADGQLLVIEWSGQLGEQTTPESRAAMPAFEHVLQPSATSPEDWQWRRADLDLCSYTTRDLAAQCVASVVRRLPAPPA